jgi:hypothetical protein
MMSSKHPPRILGLSSQPTLSSHEMNVFFLIQHQQNKNANTELLFFIIYTLVACLLSHTAFLHHQTCVLLNWIGIYRRVKKKSVLQMMMMMIQEINRKISTYNSSNSNLFVQRKGLNYYVDLMLYIHISPKKHTLYEKISLIYLQNHLKNIHNSRETWCENPWFSKSNRFWNISFWYEKPLRLFIIISNNVVLIKNKASNSNITMFSLIFTEGGSVDGGLIRHGRDLTPEADDRKPNNQQQTPPSLAGKTTNFPSFLPSLKIH